MGNSANWRSWHSHEWSQLSPSTNILFEDLLFNLFFMMVFIAHRKYLEISWQKTFQIVGTLILAASVAHPLDIRFHSVIDQSREYVKSFRRNFRINRNPLPPYWSILVQLVQEDTSVPTTQIMFPTLEERRWICLYSQLRQGLRSGLGGPSLVSSRGRIGHNSLSSLGQVM